MLPKKLKSTASSIKNETEMVDLTKNKVKRVRLTSEGSYSKHVGSMVSLATSRTNIKNIDSKKSENGLLKQTFILCKNPIYVCLVLSSELN